MPLDASKPTPLRLWGFLLTVGGGVLVAFGALRTWVTASATGLPADFIKWKGVDLPDGLIALGCGVVLIVGILILRGVGARAKRVVATLLIAAGVVAFGATGVVAVTAMSRFADVHTAAEQVAKTENISLPLALSKVGSSLSAHVQVGVYAAMLGGMLGAVGGVLSLALVTRKTSEPNLESGGEPAAE
jgi:hypothetical protein